MGEKCTFKKCIGGWCPATTPKTVVGEGSVQGMFVYQII